MDIERKLNRDELILDRVEKQQEKENRSLKPYSFEKKNVEGFKYRVQDAIKAVNKLAVKEARITEIKREIMNSDKLKTHFEDKPKDLEFLRHDKALQPALVQPHLKNIPSYLMPKVNGQKQLIESGPESIGHINFLSDKKRKKQHHHHGKVRHTNSIQGYGLPETDPLLFIEATARSIEEDPPPLVVSHPPTHLSLSPFAGRITLAFIIRLIPLHLYSTLL
jgi:ATP-dependent RNA helicase DDX56/DBP9